MSCASSIYVYGGMCANVCAQLPQVMTDLKEVASELRVDQKLLQQLSAASSLEADPTHAVTLTGNCVSHVYVSIHCLHEYFWRESIFCSRSRH